MPPISMKPCVFAATVIVSALLPRAGVGQLKSKGPVSLAPCSTGHRSGRRIVSVLDVVEFYVPRFARMTKGHDVDYSQGAIGARVEAIVIDAGWLQGGTDGRGTGKAAGY